MSAGLARLCCYCNGLRSTKGFARIVEGWARLTIYSWFAREHAMCALTVGGMSAIYSADGGNGPMSSILFPIQHGILSFVGFTVVEPFIVYAPGRISRTERVAYLGKNDPFFLPPGAEAFKRDIPNAEVHFYDTGHFALETHGREIAIEIRSFLGRALPQRQQTK